MKAKRIFTFDAAHFLANYEGKCASMHGHTYKLEITVSRLDGAIVTGGHSDGMVVDFAELSKIVKEVVIDKVDHQVLNEVFSFRTTSENIALYFYDLLHDKCKDNGLNLENVVLWESPNSSIEISSEQ